MPGKIGGSLSNAPLCVSAACVILLFSSVDGASRVKVRDMEQGFAKPPSSMGHQDTFYSRSESSGVEGSSSRVKGEPEMEAPSTVAFTVQHCL